MPTWRLVTAGRPATTLQSAVRGGQAGGEVIETEAILTRLVPVDAIVAANPTKEARIRFYDLTITMIAVTNCWYLSPEEW